MTSAPDERLMAPYRAVRRIDADGEGPWPATIVHLETGESLALVDADVLGSQWPGWASDPDGHLLAPLDVVRTSTGHGVLFPLCTRRLHDALAQRRSRGRQLTDGEVVTLVVSLARGLVELGATSETGGDWWLTDASRPVFAAGASAMSADVATRDVLSEILATVRSPAEWEWLEQWPGERRDLVRVEARAFAIATPEPLIDAPRVRGGAWSGFDELVSPTWSSSAAPSGDDRPASLFERLGRHIDADTSDLFSRVTTAAWRRVARRGEAPRRRIWALAGGAAVAVVAVGLLWPSGGDPATSAAGVSATPTASHGSPQPASESATVAPQPVVPATEPPDHSQVVSDLLTRRAACAGDDACRSVVTVAGAPDFPAGIIDAPPADRRVTLIDDYGGVAVVRVDPQTPEAGASQLVVIQRENDSWLLRDVYVAQQP